MKQQEEDDKFGFWEAHYQKIAEMKIMDAYFANSKNWYDVAEMLSKGAIKTLKLANTMSKKQKNPSSARVERTDALFRESVHLHSVAILHKTMEQK